MRRAVRRLRTILATDGGRRILRYLVTSVVNVGVAELVLAFAFGGLGWSTGPSALLAAAVAALPAYWLSRRWVWGRTGRSHLRNEVLPFWTMAVLGLGITMWAVGVGQRRSIDMGLGRLGQTVVVMASALVASGFVFVIRFVLLNRIFFADRGTNGAVVQGSTSDIRHGAR